MFSKHITSTDAFIDMPQSAQCLYFHLNMDADDDGFVSSPKRIMRMLGASEDDYKILVAKSFVIVFESGISVIKHWRIHNYIRKDTYNTTKYIDEKNDLDIKENGSYTLRGRPVDGSSTQVRLGKVRLGKVSIDENRDNSLSTKKPTLGDITAAFKDRGFEHLAESFFNYYESNGWKVGRNPMKSWTAAVAQWCAREKPQTKKTELTDKYSKYAKN